MPFKNVCLKLMAPVLMSVAVSCSAVGQVVMPANAKTSPTFAPGRCAVERVTRDDLSNMCAYDDMSALALIALADEMQFSRIWQQTDDIMRAARQMDRAAVTGGAGRPLSPSLNTDPASGGAAGLLGAPSVSEATDDRDGGSHAERPAKARRRGVFQMPQAPYGGCVTDMKVIDERWIELGRADCSEGVNEALKIKLAHLYMPGPMNQVQGAKIRRRQLPPEGMDMPRGPQRKASGLSYDEELARLKQRVCLPYVTVMYQEVCQKPVPRSYASLCDGEKTNEDALTDFWAQRQEIVAQNIIDKARETVRQMKAAPLKDKSLTSTHEAQEPPQPMTTPGQGSVSKIDMQNESLQPPPGEPVRLRLYRTDIERIEVAQNGLVDIEVCPQKLELIDMIADGLKDAAIRKTQSGLIWDMSAP